MALKENLDTIKENIKREGEVLKGEESKDRFYSSTHTFPSDNYAKQALAISKERLFNVNEWSNIPAIGTAGFELYSSDGLKLNAKKPKVGDYIKIDLPGPLPYYWVKVIDIKEGDDFGEFTVRPSSDAREADKSTTEHFFQKDATSTFRVERIGNTIHAAEIGQNEAINNDKAEAGNKAIVNTVVAEAGWAGFQKHQWQNLTSYLVDVNV